MERLIWRRRQRLSVSRPLAMIAAPVRRADQLTRAGAGATMGIVTEPVIRTGTREDIPSSPRSSRWCSRPSAIKARSLCWMLCREVLRSRRALGRGRGAGGGRCRGHCRRGLLLRRRMPRRHGPAAGMGGVSAPWRCTRRPEAGPRPPAYQPLRRQSAHTAPWRWGIHTATFMGAACSLYESVDFRRCPAFDVSACDVLDHDKAAGDVSLPGYRLDL